MIHTLDQQRPDAINTPPTPGTKERRSRRSIGLLTVTAAAAAAVAGCSSSATGPSDGPDVPKGVYMVCKGEQRVVVEHGDTIEDLVGQYVPNGHGGRLSEGDAARVARALMSIDPTKDRNDDAETRVLANPGDANYYGIQPGDEVNLFEKCFKREPSR